MWADIQSMPGVMAYGTTREAAIAAVRALAFRVAADCIDHGEMSRHHLRKSSPLHEPLAIGQSQAAFGCVNPHRMDGRLADWLSPSAQTRWVAQLYVRVSR